MVEVYKNIPNGPQSGNNIGEKFAINAQGMTAPQLAVANIIKQQLEPLLPSGHGVESAPNKIEVNAGNLRIVLGMVCSTCGHGTQNQEQTVNSIMSRIAPFARGAPFQGYAIVSAVNNQVLKQG